ncbi:MAG: tetratricopeptide repeat protein [Pyrinomonadaceae bacterium]|nr:tetratricopeptide repeat protein [Pyrinomonadaceae bacterium]
MKFFIAVALIICLLAPCGQTSTLGAHATQSRDTWRSVRTNNLFLVGNAGEGDLQQVAVWLEFFHSAFAQLVSRSVLDTSVPTTVVVFKDDASFVPFKPLYQGRPANVAGYFVPGQDRNYIALSIERGERGGRDPLSTAFHEYVHQHLMNTVPGVPLWLNEGLAEFYGSLVQANGEAVLGVPLSNYIRHLRSQQLLPLATLFSIGNDSPHYNEQDKSGVFYAQSWALVHYLMMGDGGRRQQQFKRFLSLAFAGDSTGKAVQDAFGVSLEVLEKEFKEYVRRGEFASQRIAVGNGPTGHIAMQRTAVSEGEANFYLGDLLLHIDREAEAEKYFQRAISLDSGFTQTYASLGLICVRQKRYAEAKQYLQRATESPQSYLVHYLYAYLLSREGVTASGRINEYSQPNAQIMRDQLRKAIKLAPEFADAYYLLAMVNLVTNEQLDEAVSFVKRAQKLSPSKLAYGLLLAHIHLRQRSPESARQVLEPLVRQNGDPRVRSDAQALLDSLDITEVGGSRSRSSSATADTSIIRELDQPPAATSGIVSGGSISGSAIRDGRTIDNSGPMPSVNELIDSYVEAVGGGKTLAALAAMTSRVAKGTVDVVGVSRGGTVEIYSKAPNRTLTVMRAHPFGVVKLGFNGSMAWTTGTTAKGAEVSAIHFYNPGELRANYPKITLLGKSKIGFREVYLLELQPAVGVPEKLFLDANTHLPVRVNAANVEIYLDDWREVDGVKIPFSITQRFPARSLKITLKEIQYNVALEDSLFEKAGK